MNWNIKKFKELSIEELYKILALRNEVFIVEQECAYLRILEKGVSYDKMSIGRVVVNKNYRGKGISRDMMIKAIDFIEHNLNENEIKIQAQAYLLNFYKSLGFNEISTVYLEDNIPHIDMLYKK